MAQKTIEVEVEASSIRINFPKFTIATLALPTLAGLFLMFTSGAELKTETTTTPSAAEQTEEQTEVTIEPVPSSVPEATRPDPVQPAESRRVPPDALRNPDSAQPTAPMPAARERDFVSGSCTDLNAR
ncbi:MAG: hypothetical protein WBD47_05365, partial [Phormidesmis sp.]